MKTKICSKCKIEKPTIEFNFKNKSKNTFQCSCKECDKIIRKDSYEKNKKTTYKRNKKNSEKNKNLYIEYKNKLECVTCGENHPACLDFHHKDPTIKEYNISRVVNKTTSFEKIKEEISKCIVLCSNCHRKFHYEENKKKGSHSSMDRIRVS